MANVFTSMYIVDGRDLVSRPKHIGKTETMNADNELAASGGVNENSGEESKRVSSENKKPVAATKLREMSYTDNQLTHPRRRG